MTTPPKPIQPPPRCQSCNAEMELGFTHDIGYGTVAVQRWNPGTPRSGWLGGEVSRFQYRGEGVPTLTYRCPKCFRFESFAPPAPNQP